MNIRFVKTPEKREIVEKLKEQFGIDELPFLLIESGKEKYRAFSGSLSKDEISKMSELTNIEIIGMYLLREENEEFRLSMDAALTLSKSINKNIIEINKDDFEKWIRGLDLEIKKDRGVYVIKYQEDFIGCGKSNEEKIFNYVPKDRRLKTKMPPLDNQKV